MDARLYLDRYGVAVDHLDFVQEKWDSLSVTYHPVWYEKNKNRIGSIAAEQRKYAKVQKPVFYSKIGFFIFFKNCTQEGKIADGAHEQIKCICKQGVSVCNFNSKLSDLKNKSYAHPCIRHEFQNNPQKPNNPKELEKGMDNLIHTPIQEQMLEYHIDFVLDSDMSFSKATGRSLYNFMYHGMEYMRTHPTENVEDVLKRMHRTTFSKHVKAY